jgi:hypothetical protein
MENQLFFFNTGPGFLLSEANNTMKPITGVNKREQKRNPQKPNFLCLPNTAITMLDII